MAGGIGPPQDSERRALVGKSQKESSKDEARGKAPVLRPVSSVGALGAALRVYDELAALALDPAPARRGCGVSKFVLDRADDIIGAPPREREDKLSMSSFSLANG
jgi:hypothetical protein